MPILHFFFQLYDFLMLVYKYHHKCIYLPHNKLNFDWEIIHLKIMKLQYLHKFHHDFCGCEIDIKLMLGGFSILETNRCCKNRFL
jgi:hypothetical protein